jgi:hypothetical protein
MKLACGILVYLVIQGASVAPRDPSIVSQRSGKESIDDSFVALTMRIAPIGVYPNYYRDGVRDLTGQDVKIAHKEKNGTVDVTLQPTAFPSGDELQFQFEIKEGSIVGCKAHAVSFRDKRSESIPGEQAFDNLSGFIVIDHADIQKTRRIRATFLLEGDPGIRHIPLCGTFTLDL